MYGVERIGKKGQVWISVHAWVFGLAILNVLSLAYARGPTLQMLGCQSMVKSMSKHPAMSRNRHERLSNFSYLSRVRTDFEFLERPIRISNTTARIDDLNTSPNLQYGSRSCCSHLPDEQGWCSVLTSSGGWCWGICFKLKPIQLKLSFSILIVICAGHSTWKYLVPWWSLWTRVCAVIKWQMILEDPCIRVE